MYARLCEDCLIPLPTKQGFAKKAQPWRRKAVFARSPKIDRFFGN